MGWGIIQEKKDVGGGIETYSRKSLVEKVFANQRRKLKMVRKGN